MANVGRFVKESMVEDVNAQLGERPNFFVTSLTRLPANDTNGLRQKLFASRSRLVMVKRRLGKRVVEQFKIAGLSDLLDGSVGLILAGDDALLTAKVVVEFHKDHTEQIQIRGGVVDGQLLDHKHIAELAALPSKSVLLAQVLGTLEAPLADVIFTIERLIGDIAWIAEQAAAQKPAEAVPAAPAAPEPPQPPQPNA